MATTTTVAFITCQFNFTKPNHVFHFSRLFPFHIDYYSSCNNPTKTKINIKKPLIQTINICAASSSDAFISDTTTTKEAESSDEAAAIELPDGPPSLISALNVDKALRGLAITEVDHYGVLNLPRGCSYDQVNVAYSKKLEELKLKSQELDDEELTKRYDQLKESYSILSTVEERRLYDWSLARIGNPDTYVWPNQVDITQIPCDPSDPPAQEPEDIGPTRVTGYIIVGWLMVSFVLLVLLNR